MKFGVEIQETIVLSHKLIVDAESKEKLNNILDELEYKLETKDDVICRLEEKGVECLKLIEDGSGDVEIEFPDMWEE